MKPFFSYYGSKHRLCQQGFYPPPKVGNIVIEPFAGSATYSVYHESEHAILIDKDPVIANRWADFNQTAEALNMQGKGKELVWAQE